MTYEPVVNSHEISTSQQSGPMNQLSIVMTYQQVNSHEI